MPMYFIFKCVCLSVCGCVHTCVWVLVGARGPGVPVLEVEVVVDSQKEAWVFCKSSPHVLFPKPGTMVIAVSQPQTRGQGMQPWQCCPLPMGSLLHRHPSLRVKALLNC